MRIAVFTDAFHPEVGGIAQSLLASGATLARRGHAVLYAIPGGERFAGAVSVPEDGTLGGEVSVLRLPAVPGGKGAGHGRVVVPTGLGALRCRAWAPDVIHAHGPFGAGGLGSPGGGPPPPSAARRDPSRPTRSSCSAPPGRTRA